ncbi:MAG: UDP-galactopyranose mutase [Bacilli bacterium]|nr:UDP-galactopyranose mutase [Bacilli bacterium]
MKINYKKYDAVVIGAGCAGATIANRLANTNKRVLVIDKRPHIAGNAYDYFDQDKIIIHQYGPHIFHTNYQEVFNFLKKFSPFFKYEHRVLGNLDNKLVPVPFNFKSLELTHPKKEASQIKKLLLKYFKGQTRVSIFELLNHKDPTIKKFGQFVFDKVFAYYTAKQWNIKIKDIDKSVINRVPVVLGYQDTYFGDKYQFMPSHGYTYMFKNMLRHKNITVKLSTNITKHIKFKNKKIYLDGELYQGKFIYTGAIDELFNYQFGVLPYRSLDIKLSKIKKTYYQKAATVNYLTSEKFTRISEYKYFLKQNIKGKTVIAKEYSKAYSLKGKTDPYYPINNTKNNAMYLKYKKLADTYHIYLSGRLAEYKYYNMDLAILNALQLVKKIK